jgi:hypothetical protein
MIAARHKKGIKSFDDQRGAGKMQVMIYSMASPKL